MRDKVGTLVVREETEEIWAAVVRLAIWYHLLTIVCNAILVTDNSYPVRGHLRLKVCVIKGTNRISLSQNLEVSKKFV